MAEAKKQPDNILYYGDNLDILKRYIKDESVDLIYLDPPFKSNQDYNVLFAEQNGSRSKSQLKAFEDTWEWNQEESAPAYQKIVETGPEKVSKAMQAFWTFLGASDMMAYLAMMAPRLVELKRVLKETGSIYLHCDPTASHYLKMLMDAVFGVKNFQNEIIWAYKSGGATTKRFARKHDVLLFYARDADSCRFNVQKEKSYNRDLKPYRFKGVKEYQDEVGWYTLVNMKDVWQIDMVGRTSAERLGYPTQKPEALLERIIQISSNEGDTVLDPFCGCGTTVAAAQRLNRRWIGIDITQAAIVVIKKRLRDTFGDEAIPEVVGEPVTVPDAEVLAREKPYQFQWWALGLVDARPAEEKKGADKGIDGRLYFHDEPEGGKTKQVIFSVKAGNPTVSHLRDLRGVVEREKAEIGVLICMTKPTKAMRTEAASAGFYKSHWGNHPRLQLLTIAELMEGKRIDLPPSGDVRTFKKAPKSKDKPRKPPTLNLPLL